MGEASGWMPIETAPKDGTPIRAATESNRGFEVLRFPYPLTWAFIDGQWRVDWQDGTWRTCEPLPTHWKPRPTPSAKP